MGDNLVGIDLGGTKIEVAVLDPAGSFLLRERVPTPRDDYDGSLTAIAALIDRTLPFAAADTPIGIGMPGAVSPTTGRVKNANSTWLNGRFLAADLARVLGRPVRLQNDANCLAVSEAVDGAAAGAAVVFAVILGTGVGGGIALDGRVHAGAHAIAGEWGHNPLPWASDEESPGPACWCGKRGCIETWLSGPALAAERQRDGPQVARSRYGGRLARALATVINLIDPDVIVLGGGVSNLPGLSDDVGRGIGAFVFSDRIDTPIRVACHGDSSGVRGAAWLWRSDSGGRRPE
ncbi:MAG: ROK family protein [Burkholderiaceae bacterium]